MCRHDMKFLVLTVLLALLAGLALAQRTARDMPSHSTGTPEWTNDAGFEKDVFTFVRIKYDVNGKYLFGHTAPDRRWLIDAPDSDLNFSFRLQQMTALKVNPQGLFLELTDKELFDYPFIYIVEPGRLTFTDEQAAILRRYLLNGGFLMVDDFWGDVEWGNFHQELKLVFPDKEPQDLPADHPIFHCVYDLKARPQVPGLPHGIASQWRRDQNGQPITWEQGHRYGPQPDAREPHYRALFDDKGRMMAILCHNTDLGDGWEREGENEYYFREFSESKAYPMGINIIFYAMTQ